MHSMQALEDLSVGQQQVSAALCMIEEVGRQEFFKSMQKNANGYLTLKCKLHNEGPSKATRLSNFKIH